MKKLTRRKKTATERIVYALPQFLANVIVSLSLTIWLYEPGPLAQTELVKALKEAIPCLGHRFIAQSELAKALFDLLGVVAYLCPIWIFWGYFQYQRLARQQLSFREWVEEFSVLATQLVGMVGMNLALCSLSAIYLAGGAVGAQSLVWMDQYNHVLVCPPFLMLALFLASFQLFSGISVIDCMHWLGSTTLGRLVQRCIPSGDITSQAQLASVAEAAPNGYGAFNAVQLNQEVKASIVSEEMPPPIHTAVREPIQTEPVTKAVAFPTFVSQEREDKSIPVQVGSPFKAPPTNTPIHSNWNGEEAQELLQKALLDYKIQAYIEEVSAGPVITQYALSLAPGIKVSRVAALAKDLARALSVSTVRIVETLPGKPFIGLEIPNAPRQTVPVKKILTDPLFTESTGTLPLALGVTSTGNTYVLDLCATPHLLIAGTTGSGKSTCMHTILISLLYKPNTYPLKLLLIDPKQLEFFSYNGLSQLLCPVVTDPEKAIETLEWCVEEMEMRYKRFVAVGVRHLADYNHLPVSVRGTTQIPYIVVCIDEFADLMMTSGKRLESLIVRLAQKSRAAGLHLIVSTQRPSVDVITGIIKANIPSRIALSVSSKVDSRTILDQNGAESLLGKGDMLLSLCGSADLLRLHGPIVTELDLEQALTFLKQSAPATKPIELQTMAKQRADFEAKAKEQGEGNTEDDLYEQVCTFVQARQTASISAVQRRFKIGYNRSARMIERMEQAGILSPASAGGVRKVLKSSHYV